MSAQPHEIPELADVHSHHIEGLAVHGDTPFSMPLISHITGNLWTGGCLHGVPLPSEFRHVISLYPWERYDIDPGATTRVEVTMYDADGVPAPADLFGAAGRVLGALRDGPTLVHCQAGLNRSALVAGLAMILSGMDPASAIALLRERRSDAVLCNPTFERWLREAKLDPVL